MKLFKLIGLLMGISFVSLSFAKAKILNFNSLSSDYTYVIQDIAVFQESCQNHSAGHYFSKLYDFKFFHDSNNECIIHFGSGSVAFRVSMDDEAKHVIKTMNLNGKPIVEYDVSLSQNGQNEVYSGTVTTFN